MKIRAGKIFFSILSKLILNQNGFLLSKILHDFGLRNFDSGLLLLFVYEQLKPGTYEVDWDGSSYASGVYLYPLITSEFAETKKLILLK